MAEVVPQTRPLSEVDADPSEVLTSVEKKPRLDSQVERSVKQAIASTSTATTTTTKQKPANGEKQSKKKASRKKKQKHLPPEPYSHDDVLWRDVRDLLGLEVADGIIEEGKEWESPFQCGEEFEVEVSAISSTGTYLRIYFPLRQHWTRSFCSSGDGLALAPSPKPPWVIAVPFALPGEVARVKMHQNRRLHTISSLLEIKTPNPALRDDSRIKCRYFGVCGGCQYQVNQLWLRSVSLMLKSLGSGKQLSYDTQLDLKRDVIVKAYRNFSGTVFTAPSVVYLLNSRTFTIGLSKSSLPTIGTTMPSPLQYGYRTKITPHFKEPPKKARKHEGPTKPEWLKIGFNINDTSQVLDIEVSLVLGLGTTGANPTP